MTIPNSTVRSEAMDDRYLHRVLSDYDRRTAENERNISALHSDMTDLKTQISGQSALIKQIADKVNAPSTFNIFGAIAAITTLVVAGAGFVTLVAQPIKDNINELQSIEVAAQAWRIEESYKQGRQDATLEQYEIRISELEDRLD